MRLISRPKREWFPGAVYHIMGRGNHRQEIYKDSMDYEYFLTLLSFIQGKVDFDLHAICLMTNHFHMLLETKDKEIWRIMKPLCQNHAEYYNDKYGLVGHLYQGRYKSCLVRTDSQFLQTSRYIHLNPVKAKMVTYPEEYKWSSYRTILGMEDEKMVNREKTLAYFRKPQEERYRNFVESTSLMKREMEQAIQKEMGEDDLWLPW